MIRVRDILESKVLTVTPDTPVRDLVRLLSDHEVTGVPVVDGKKGVVGVVSISDILRLARDLDDVPEALRWGKGSFSPSATGPGPAGEGNGEKGEFFAYYVSPTGVFVDLRERMAGAEAEVFAGYRVEDIMTPAPVTISPDASLKELAALLRSRKVHRVVVEEGGKLVGIVTTTDLLKAVAEE